MSSQQQAQINLLALPPAQRQVLLYLVREGPTQEEALRQVLKQDGAALAAILAVLKRRGAITVDSNGYFTAALGRTRRRALPARLWPALQTANRPYTAQEIATLRTVVPILQFARARMGEFTDHGPGHVLRVKAFATQLGYVLGLTADEQHLLRAAALLHDVGNVIDRATHHLISQETVERLTASGHLPFSSREAALIGLLCRWHRKEYDPNRQDTLAGTTVRTGLIASILRVADALDSDYRRVDYDEKFKQVLQLFYPEEVPFLADLDTILGIRICCTPSLRLQVFVREGSDIAQSYHIRALHKDVNETPLPCTIEVTLCSPTPQPATHPAQSLANPDQPVALIAFPFEPHSLVMAALSRKHLLTEGHAVELLSYPDAPTASDWLWRTELAERDPQNYSHLILIGDRPDPAITSTLLSEVKRWQMSDAQVTLLNRHEANWGHLPDLLQQHSTTSINVILGGDWAYFWGDHADEADLFWGRIAALCTRDPIQSTVGLNSIEQAISQGLLNAVYERIAEARQSADESGNWGRLATTLLNQIAADERDWFAKQSTSFADHCTRLPPLSKLEGRVIRFELSEPPVPHAVFWRLEAAIEGGGRAPVRGIRFNTPYAIATWPEPTPASNPDESIVELLAINHWREEEATPIRLLYPTDVAPVPDGNECAIRVRLPVKQAQQVVQALIAACNEI